MTEQELSLLSTATPNIYFSRKIHIACNEYFVEKFVSYLDVISFKLKYDTTGLKNKLLSLDTNLKIHPSIFMSFFQLIDSMKTGVVYDIKKSISNIMDVLQNALNDKIFFPNISSVGSESWEYSYIEKLKSYDQKNIRGETTEIYPVSENMMPFHIENIQSALNMIESADKEIYDEIKEFVTHIKIFEGKVLRGDTSNISFGSIWLRVPEPEDDQVGYWIEHIVHETSHIRLEAHFFLEKLVLNSRDEKIFRAPIRDDLRPMRGIFHASFVLSRMVRIFTILSINGYDKRFRDRLQLCKLQFEIGLNTLEHPKARLSNNGLLIKKSLKECAYI
ncbi:HEXXH motif-containing putative peptide modification protein [Moraxella haemolytica]|uniref:aKG-HExxH-type peptide beta-hydroxylase n=1 Tax=Moraxella haemolytica TaxID=2904119 RepID=UPI0025436EF8|nr:HEXXH motif-containing putative peptide modification protein [Moraxella sp. ZY171148]WII94915.1 HEXXH motif-containing putative peptide modification protein [Moraxella sp. ZY171148]